MVIAHLEELMDQGKFDEAWLKIENLEEKDQLDGKLYRLRLLFYKKELNKAFDLAIESHEDSIRIGNKALECTSLAYRAWTLSSLGKSEESFSRLNEAEKLYGILSEEERKEIHWEGGLFWLKGTILLSRGEIDLALEYAQKSLELCSTIPYKSYATFTLGLIGSIFQAKGDIDLALEYNQRGLDIAKELGIKRWIAVSTMGVGEIYSAKGKLDLALKCYLKSLRLNEKVKPYGYMSEWGIHRTIGSIFYVKGELDEAMESYEKALETSQSSGHLTAIAISLFEIGRVLFKKKQVKQAIEYSIKGLEKLPSNRVLTNSWMLYEIILIYVNMNKVDQAQDYFNKLEKLNEKHEVKEINIRYRLTKAMMLKSSGRMKYKIDSQRIFEEIIKEENIPHEFTVFAMLNLCDILLYELEISREEQVFQEADEFVREIYEIAQEQNSHNLLVESLILRSKFELIKTDVHQSMKSLEQAKIIAEERGLTFMFNKVIEEQRDMEKKLSMWRELIEKDVSLEERLENVRIRNYIENALKIATYSPPSPEM